MHDYDNLTEKWREFLTESCDKQEKLFLNEAHGLSKEDEEYIENFIKKTEDKELKRILRFIVKSNIKVEKTQDVTKMKKK